MIIWLVIAVLIAVLAVLPVKISVYSVRSKGIMHGNLHVSWLVFMVRYEDMQIEFIVLGKRVVSRHIEERPRMPGPEMSTETIFNMAGAIFRLFKDLFHAFRLRYLDADITFGFSNPAYTGILTGFMHALLDPLQTGSNIRWAADFTKPVLEWELKVKASSTPIQLLPPLARFIFSFSRLSGL